MALITHNERRHLGVRWWELGKQGFWLRNTKVRSVQPYDPKPRLALGRYRVAVMRTTPKVRRMTR